MNPRIKLGQGQRVARMLAVLLGVIGLSLIAMATVKGDAGAGWFVMVGLTCIGLGFALDRAVR